VGSVRLRIAEEYVFYPSTKNLLKEIGKGHLRSAVRHHSAKELFALLKGKFSGMHGDVARCKEKNELMAYTRRTLVSEH
jgi:hypothetical protein